MTRPIVLVAQWLHSCSDSESSWLRTFLEGGHSHDHQSGRALRGPFSWRGKEKAVLRQYNEQVEAIPPDRVSRGLAPGLPFSLSSSSQVENVLVLPRASGQPCAAFWGSLAPSMWPGIFAGLPRCLWLSAGKMELPSPSVPAAFPSLLDFFSLLSSSQSRLALTSLARAAPFQAGRRASRRTGLRMAVYLLIRVSFTSTCVWQCLAVPWGPFAQGSGWVEGPDEVAGGGDGYLGPEAVERVLQTAWILFCLFLCPSPSTQVCSQIFSPFRSNRALSSSRRPGLAWRPR